MNRTQAKRVVTMFEDEVVEAAFAGTGHPDLIEWRKERLAIARERMIRRLVGDRRPTQYMPKQPEISYD